MKIRLLVLFICLWGIACKQKKECFPYADFPLEFISLEDSLFSVSSKQTLKFFLANHIVVREVFFNRPAYPNDSIFIADVYQRITHPAMDTLLHDTKKVFGNGATLKKELANAFAGIKNHFPEYSIPKVETTLSGFVTDLYISDTLIVIGLDYFLGRNAKYRPQMYDYMLTRYKAESVAPMITFVTSLDGRFNTVDPTDQTLLAEMISFGKAYYFTQSVMPCVEDSVLMGYSTTEMIGVKENTLRIWKHFVEQELFYKNDRRIKQKYVMERPKTLEISPECPGRIGAWLGWEIVKSFMAHHQELSVHDLMLLQDAHYIFKESKYKPE